MLSATGVDTNIVIIIVIILNMNRSSSKVTPQNMASNHEGKNKMGGKL